MVRWADCALVGGCTFLSIWVASAGFSGLLISKSCEGMVRSVRSWDEYYQNTFNNVSEELVNITTQDPACGGHTMIRELRPHLR